MKKKIILSLLCGTIMLTSCGEKEVDTRQFAFDNYNKYTAEASQASNAAKEESIENYRQYYKIHGQRRFKFKLDPTTWQEALEALQADGTFSNISLDAPEWGGHDTRIGDRLSDAWVRLGKIAEAYSEGKISLEESFTDAYQKAILYYGEAEIARPLDGGRFHGSCFAMPTGAMNVYFSYLDVMDKVESGEEKNEQLIAVCDMLKVIALQAWTQPVRNDFTDEDVSSVERFRNHVWWVGGNGLAFRSLLPVACMYKSIPMIDVLAETCQKAIDWTSQVTNQTAFWTEGFTADGAGWGHGMQCLIWGYPISGTSAAMNLMRDFKGTAWEQNLSEQNIATLMNYIRGSNWYYYAGYPIPGLGRATMAFNNKPESIGSDTLVDDMLTTWRSSLSEEIINELEQFKTEYTEMNIRMHGYTDGWYAGTRWFFNNDDLMKKTDDYHIMVNMSSVRCDGIESATGFADEYNFCTTDGATMIQRDGQEYRSIFGAYDVLSYPGVTARQGMDKLIPVTNWRGYCSKHNFAAGATFGGENAVAGILWEKLNGSEKEGTNDKGTNIGKNEILYGILAHKSYFMLGDYMIALGAGVSNLTPEVEGDFHTTLDQTAWTADVMTIDANGNKEKLSAGTYSFFQNDAPLWVVQEGKFAYTILPEFTKEASFSLETRKQDWLKMNLSNKKHKNLPTEANVLQLWADHGATPINDTYGYVVYAGKGNPAKELPFTVVANNRDVQAIESTCGNVFEAVFYTNELTSEWNNMEISVSEPCALLIEKNANGTCKVAVSDPTMNPELKSITVKIADKSVDVAMPTADQTGRPAIAEIK